MPERRMQRNDIRMRQACLNLDLTQEPLFQAIRLMQVGQQHLHRFHAVRNSMPHPVDLAHAAPADALQYLVTARMFADFEAHNLTSIQF